MLLLGFGQKYDKLLQDEILITLESYSKKDQTILFDFLDFDHYTKFNQLLGNGALDDKRGASMLYITNFKEDRKFAEGTYYNINKENINIIRNQITLQDDSSIIRYKIDLKKEPISILFIQSKIPSDFLNTILKINSGNASDKLIDFGNAPTNSIDLIVRNVGQGSWNEFNLNNVPKLIFDLGTAYTASKSVVKGLIAQREKDYQKSNPTVIISHWDVDHYHLLLEAEDETIKSIRNFYHRSIIPNATANRVVQRFKDLKNEAALISINCVDPVPPNRYSEKLVLLKHFEKYFSLYNGSKHRNRNKSGLLLIFNSKRISLVCGADFHYSQINDSILPSLSFVHEGHYLIVPHHGGDAGKFIYNLKGPKFRDAIISVGKNSYGHPFDNVKDSLTAIKFKHIDFKTKDKAYYYKLKLR